MKKKDSEKTIFVTQGNYYSNEMAKIYTGSTQIKSFLKCEAEAMAELNEEWQEDTSEALLVSSYVDAYFSDELFEFQDKHPEIFTKQNTLKAQYKNAEEIIKQIEDDPVFVKYLNGTPQVIMTGEISGVPVKIRIDSYHEGKAIVDLKCIKDFNLIWNEETHERQNFIDYYDYVLQGALYQEIVRQTTGKKLPFIIAAATKEKVSQRALLNIPQDVLDQKLEFLKQYLPHLQEVKEGKVPPTECGHCNYCLSKKKTLGVVNYQDFFGERS